MTLLMNVRRLQTAALLLLAGAVPALAQMKPVPCQSETWQVWRGYTIPTPTGKAPMELDVPGGRLVGMDRGEWIGRLLFRGLDGQEFKIADGNVKGILPWDDGVIVLFGLTHRNVDSGHAMFFKEEAGRWWSKFIGDLGGAPRAVTVIDDKTIAVLAGHGFWSPIAVRVQSIRGFDAAICVKASAVRPER